MGRRAIARALLISLLLGAALMVWLTVRQEPRPGIEGAVPSVAAAKAPPRPVTPSPSAAVEPPIAPPPDSPLQEPTAIPPATTATAVAPVATPVAAPLDPAMQAAPVAPPPGEIHTEIEGVGTMIRDFRNAVGGNPVGTNAEITKALLGDNPKQVKFELPPGVSVNGAGELQDRWGTPFFFHQVSGVQMDIRSAGPDHQMWNEDDVSGR